MVTYKGENQLKIWVLKPEGFPQGKEFSSSPILLSAIKNLRNQAEEWTYKYKYLPKVKLEALGRQCDPASVHAKNIREILDGVSDLKDILQEKNHSKEFDRRIAELDQIEMELKQFHEQIHRIEHFVAKLQEKEIVARSLMVDPKDEIAGCEKLKEQWHEIIKMNLSEDLKGHPALDWVENLFEKLINLRTNVQQKIDFVKLAHQFDRQFGNNIEDVRDFVDEEKENSHSIRSKALMAYLKYTKERIPPRGTWIDWAYSQIIKLEKHDPENHTNWRDLIKYGNHHGDIRVKEYLVAENERIRIIHKALEELPKLLPPTIHSRYGEMLSQADYGKAYHQICNWAGFQAEITTRSSDDPASNYILRQEIEKLAETIRNLDDVESLKKFLSDNPTEASKDPSIFMWCQKTIEKIRKIRSPTLNLSESSSNVYQSLYRELQSVQDYSIRVVQVVYETLMDLSDKITTYQTALDTAEDKTRRFISESKRSFLWFREKRKQRLIKQRNQAVCDAYQVAPHSKYVKEKMDEFGIESCSKSSFQFFNPNIKIRQMS